MPESADFDCLESAMPSLDPELPDVLIISWHAHIYFDGPAQRATAAALREAIGQRFAVQLGRWHDVLVGPHTRAMYQVAFDVALFERFVPWLALHRNGLDVLVHPNTLAPRADHIHHALWLGQRLAVKPETLPERISAEQEDPVQVNTQPSLSTSPRTTP